MRLGMLTPSSNTVLEPLTAAMLADLPGASAHFSRFRVVGIDLGAGSRGQFDPAPVVAAAELLADARVDAICWNGTSGAWLGLEVDRALCGAVTARTGIPATTATLALVEALRRLGARRYGLVTPYLGEVQAAIVARWAAIGLECAAERHLEDPGNFSFAEHGEEAVRRMVGRPLPRGPTRWWSTAPTSAAAGRRRSWRRNSACRCWTASPSRSGAPCAPRVAIRRRWRGGGGFSGSETENRGPSSTGIPLCYNVPSCAAPSPSPRCLCC